MVIRPPSSQPRVLGFWRPPFFYGWLIVSAVFVAEFVGSGVGSFMVPLFFKPISQEMGWSLTMLTGVVTAQTIANAGVAPILGPLVDKIGAKPIMLWGALIAGLGLLLLTRITAVWQLWVLYAAVGTLGLNEMGGLTGSVLITKWFRRKRGRALSMATLGTTAGGAIMAPVLGFLIASRGWRETLGLMGIFVTVLMLPVVLALVRSRPEDMGLLPDGEAAAVPTADGRPTAIMEPEVSWTPKEAFRTPTLWILITGLNLIQLSADAIVIHLVPFLTLQQGMSAQGAGVVLTFRLVVATFSRVIWGFAADRFPMRFCLAGAFLSRALSPAALVLLPYPTNVVVMLITNVFGGGFQILRPLAFGNYYGREHSGAIQGMTRPFLLVSSVVGPLVISVIFDLTGTFNLAFLVAAGLGMFASASVVFAKPPVKRQSAAAVPAVVP